jgi:hypothetical protein
MILLVYTLINRKNIDLLLSRTGQLKSIDDIWFVSNIH